MSFLHIGFHYPTQFCLIILFCLLVYLSLFILIFLSFSYNELRFQPLVSVLIWSYLCRVECICLSNCVFTFFIAFILSGTRQFVLFLVFNDQHTFDLFNFSYCLFFFPFALISPPLFSHAFESGFCLFLTHACLSFLNIRSFLFITHFMVCLNLFFSNDLLPSLFASSLCLSYQLHLPVSSVFVDLIQ